MRGMILAIALVSVFEAGCASTTVKKNPGARDKGVRFYRPKPYLLLTPTGGNSDDFVSIKLEYLPDFSEEYSIHVRAGIGTNKTKITLDNGWNLTKVDYDIDSKIPENINAVANLIDKVGGIIPSAKGAEPGRGPIKASNVPLGYYEAVIGYGPDGSKQLYGWRYLGFVPYAQCPMNIGGGDCANCDSLPIYGLVFENGIMTFKQLPETMHANNIKDPKQGPKPVITVEDKEKLRQEAVKSLQKLLKNDFPADRLTLEQVDKTFKFTLSLTPTTYDAVVMAAEGTTAAEKLASLRLKASADVQPLVKKYMKEDPSFVADVELKKLP